MMQRREWFILLFWFCSFSVGITQSDSTVLRYADYMEKVSLHHPLAKKANLQTQIGTAAILAAKGNMDPVLSSSWRQKKFDEKLYYRQYQGALKIPTLLGIDVVAGYENTAGVFLNPENKTDEFGLWHLGIEANLIQGLIINERKTALQQAEIIQQMTDNEGQIIRNELLFKAARAYLDWHKYYRFQEVLNENLAIANQYFENTKQAYRSGEKTTMDTLEASIINQEAINLLQKNELFLIKAQQSVENYLWYKERPVQLKSTTLPEDFSSDFFETPINPDTLNIIKNHPQILATINKQAYYEVEQKLKREKLKPKLKVKYNPLLSSSENSISPNFNPSNFKWGFDFSMPLLFRSEKAAIQQGAIKIQETGFDLQTKKNELRNKIEGSLQQQLILQEQLRLVEQNVEGYQRLLEGENEKFLFGESSVFLLNKRQEKYINGQLKLIALQIKLQLEILNYRYYINGLE